MKRLSLSLPALAAFGVLGLTIGFGMGRIGRVGVAEGPADREAGAAASESVLEPPAVTGSSLAEKAARAEVRAFQPGRPFPTGGAEAWLLGLHTGSDDRMDMGGVMATVRQLGMLDAESAREVAEAIGSIFTRLEADEEGDETLAHWEEADEILMVGLITSLGIVAEDDPEKALAILGTLEDAEEEHMAMILSQIARNGPDRVESLLSGMDGEAFPMALYGAVHGLLDADPEAAMALLRKYPGEDFEDVWEETIERLMQREPRRGIEVAAAYVSEGENMGTLASAVLDWLEKDPTSARAWVENFQGPGRDAAMARLLAHDAAEDPQRVMREYAAMRARGVSEADLGDVAGRIAGGLAKGDVNAARTWVETLPEGEGRSDAIKGLANVWVHQDAPAASQWIATLPRGEARDDAARVIARQIAESDPAAAYAWAGSIDNVPVRRSEMEEVLDDWIKIDPVAGYAAAAAYAAAANALPEAE